MGYFFVNIPFTQTPNPLYWSYYIYYIYIFMLHAKQPSPFNKLWCIVIKRSNCPLFCPTIDFLHGGGQVIGIGKKVRQNEKINAMDLIKYMPYTRATPQSLLKRTEGLLTIKKLWVMEWMVWVILRKGGHAIQMFCKRTEWQFAFALRHRPGLRMFEYNARPPWVWKRRFWNVLRWQRRVRTSEVTEVTQH